MVRARAELRLRLEERREEIEREVLTRIDAVAVSTDIGDPAYTQGLRAAVSAAIDYAFEAIERGEERAPEPPPELLAQARLAARSGVGLDTVLRRYVAGYALLGDYLARESEVGRLPSASTGLLRGLAAVFDRLIAVVGDAYTREAESRSRSTEWRRAERVQRLLAGEPLDTSDIPYEFGGHHVGLVAEGRDAADAIRTLADSMDARLLFVRRDETSVWVWLGTRRPLDLADVEEAIASDDGTGPAAVALGEPGEDLVGWRLTHRQAAAAFPIALRGRRLVRYAEVPLLAAVLADDLLATSLRRLYLEPLEVGRDGGETAKGTLRAYFASNRNISSSAAAMRLSRSTVRSRLREVEARIGKGLDECALELEVALRHDELAVDGADRRGNRTFQLG